MSQYEKDINFKFDLTPVLQKPMLNEAVSVHITTGNFPGTNGRNAGRKSYPCCPWAFYYILSKEQATQGLDIVTVYSLCKRKYSNQKMEI